MPILIAGRPGQIQAELTADPPVAVQMARATLYDEYELVVPSMENLEAVFTPTTAARRILLSVAWAAPVEGQYRCVWVVTYEDGRQETFATGFECVALPPVDEESSYDPSTPIGEVRFFAKDTGESGFIWSDAEIGLALAKAASNPAMAAYFLLITDSVRAARHAIATKTNTTQTDERAVAKEIRAAAEPLKEIAAMTETDSGGVCDSPTQVFRPTYDDEDGNMGVFPHQKGYW